MTEPLGRRAAPSPQEAPVHHAWVVPLALCGLVAPIAAGADHAVAPDSLAVQAPSANSDSLATIAASPAPPRASEPSAHRPLISFSPHPSERCVSFLFVEATVDYVSGRVSDGMDQWLITDGFGLMVNARRLAIGGGAELRFTRGHADLAPTLHIRRWLAGEQSIEVALGYATPAAQQMGTRLTGAMGSVRYCPNSYVFLQAGQCRFHDTNAIFYDPETGGYHAASKDFTRTFAGMGFTGAAGAAIWGVEASLALLAIIAFAIVGGMMEGY